MSASSEVEVAAEVVLPADLHARPAGQVARAASGHEASVWLSIAGRPEVDARSVLAVMGLGAVAGSTVRVRACGADAEAALRAVCAVLDVAEAVAG